MLARLGFDADLLAAPADLLARPPAALAEVDVLLLAVSGGGGGDSDAGPAWDAVAELRRREEAAAAAAGGAGRRRLAVVGLTAKGVEGWAARHAERGCRWYCRGWCLPVRRSPAASCCG